MRSVKKFCIWLVLVLLLTGCGRAEPQSPGDQSLELVTFDIYAINDLHGKLADSDSQSGVDELTTYLKQAQQSKNTIILSTGDMWQGASESNLTGGLIVTDWMNQLGFSAMVLGGHEFDWGEDAIRQNAEQAAFPLLGINVYNRTTNTQVDYCQSSVVIQIDGAQIGIIGAIGDCYGSIDSENVRDITFKTGPELTTLVKSEARKLRSEGVDFIIYAIHDGYTTTTNDTQALSVNGNQLKKYYDISLSDGDIDLVFEADTHYWYTLQDPFGVYHLQAGGNNAGIAHARVLIDCTNQSSMVLSPELIPASKYNYLEDDPIVETLLDKYAQQIAPAYKVLGNNGQYRNGASICRLVADLYCKKGVEKWGADYDIVLGGGYISCRSPGYLPAGEVQYSQLQALLPFDNEISLCSIRGRDLISKFLETTNSAYYIQTTPYGESIRDQIDPNATYYVVTDSYTAGYSYNNMTVIDTYSKTLFARDLLAEYIIAGKLG